MSFEQIPLNKLSLWKGNVRKTGAAEGIDELKASIRAQGLISPLTVQKGEKGERRVVAGQRRLLALRALQKEGVFPEDHPVACTILSNDSNATEISLAENVVRSNMHPADQFEAFRDLIDKGSGVTEIAARFGVSETTVTKRLKLGRIAPKLLDLYRKGEMKLEQIEALTLTDDHAVQVAAWEDAQGWQREPRELRKALTTGEVSGSDRRVQFIGLDAYEAAGGTVRRDLFDGRNAGYVSDVALLDKLVIERLETIAAMTREEGWKWVEITPEFQWDAVKGYLRVRPRPIELSAEDRETLATLSEEYDEIAALDEEEGMDSEQEARFEVVREEMERLSAKEEAFAPEDMARAGVIISIGHDAKPQVQAGWIRMEDQPETEDDAEGGEKPAKDTSGLSAALLQDLNAQRTAALRVELAGSPMVALAATVHALGLSAFYLGSYRVSSCLGASLHITALDQMVKDREGSPAVQACAEIGSSWKTKIPAEAEDFWQWCVEQSLSTLLDLLAVLVGRSVDATGVDGRKADYLAASLDLDMTKYFRPTADNFFSHLPKPALIDTLAQMDGGNPVSPMTEKLKKGALAEMAEKSFQAWGGTWLPDTLKTKPTTAQPQPETDDGIAA